MSAETTLYISRQTAEQFAFSRMGSISNEVMALVITAIVQDDLIDPVVDEMGGDDEEFARRTA